MKKLMCAFLVMIGAVVAANAQDNPTPSSDAAATEQHEGMVKIKSEELPDAVKKGLEAQEFKGWLINSAYQDEKKETYHVELKNGAETKTVKFNKEGEKIE